MTVHHFELNKLFFRYDEAAKILSVSKTTLTRLIDSGEIERVYVGMGKTPRVTRESILEYAEKQKEKTGSRVHP